MSAAKSPPPEVKRQFMRGFRDALRDPATYNPVRNPSVWLGFVLALPIPLFTFFIESPWWLKLIALVAPFTWAAILGAAGRVGLRAQQETVRMSERVDEVVSQVAGVEGHLAETEEALGEEVLKRQHLEDLRDEVVSDLRLAKDVQRTLIPHDIQRPEANVVTRMIASRLIGGDYVHTNIVGDRYLYLIVADVSGHGIAAALVVARFHGFIRRLTLLGRTPMTMLRRMNEAAMQLFMHTYFFMTCAVARIDLYTGLMEYATAGHPDQFLLRANGEIEHLRTPNRLLGIDADIFDASRPSDQVQLEPGDSVIFFTDGMFEVLADGSGELLGEDGLEARIREFGPLEPSLLIGEVLQELAEFQGRSDFEDDVTISVTQFLGTTPPLARHHAEHA